ncbi:hairy and enhancer of split related-7 [Symphorus nematophorus]
MKFLQDSEDAKATRKSLKPQVERRRRERMNRSLESLKTLLMQRQEATQRRVEKAEILEHTVLFLQKIAAGGKTRAESGGGDGGGGGQKNSFQDGFSTCLQRAAQYLGPEGKGLWLGAALDASFAARFSRSDSDSAGVHRRTEAHSSSNSSLLLIKSSRSILQQLIHRSGHTRCVQSRGEPHRSHTTPQQPHKVSSRASKQSPSQSQALSQSLWRPWP